MSNQENDDLRWIFTVIRRWWWLIAGCALLAGVVALVVASRQTPLYEATTTLLIDPARNIQTSDYTALITGERLTLTYSQMLKGRSVLQDVIALEGMDKTPEELANRITIEPVRDTQLIRLTVKDSSPEGAASLANTIAKGLMNLIKELQAERYNSSLDALQAKIDVLSTQIEATLSRIDDLSMQKISADVNLDRLDKILTEQQSEYRGLLQDYQVLLSTVDQLKSGVSIIESAQLPDDQTLSPYTATVTLLLTGRESTETYGNVMTGRPVLEAAIAEVGLEMSPEELVNRITVEPVRNTQLVRLSVKDSKAALAVDLANAIAEAFIAQVQTLQTAPYVNSLATKKAQMDHLLAVINQTQEDLAGPTAQKIQVETELARLEGQLAEQRNDNRVLQQDHEQVLLTAAQAADTIVVAEPAQIPTGPVSAGKLRNAFIAAVIGAGLGIGLAFSLEYLDDTLHTSDDVRRVIGLNTFGVIGRLSKGEDELVVISQPLSPIAEAFRMLATNLRFASIDKPLHTLLVTSPGPLEGKSTVAANLAATLAQKEQQVVLVDADMRLPRLHQVFGFEQCAGLANVLSEGSLDGNLQTTPVDCLKVLVAGETPSNPAEMIDSPRMHKVITDLAQEADLLVIDSPPVLTAADAVMLAAVVDGVLLVLRAGQTRRQAARYTVESLRQVKANIIGVVLNGVAADGVGYYHYRYRSHENRGNGATRQARWKRIPQLNNLKYIQSRLGRWLKKPE